MCVFTTSSPSTSTDSVVELDFKSDDIDNDSHWFLRRHEHDTYFSNGGLWPDPLMTRKITSRRPAPSPFLSHPPLPPAHIPLPLSRLSHFFLSHFFSIFLSPWDSVDSKNTPKRLKKTQINYKRIRQHGPSDGQTTAETRQCRRRCYSRLMSHDVQYIWTIGSGHGWYVSESLIAPSMLSVVVGCDDVGG